MSLEQSHVTGATKTQTLNEEALPWASKIAELSQWTVMSFKR